MGSEYAVYLGLDKNLATQKLNDVPDLADFGVYFANPRALDGTHTSCAMSPAARTQSIGSAAAVTRNATSGTSPPRYQPTSNVQRRSAQDFQGLLAAAAGAAAGNWMQASPHFAGSARIGAPLLLLLLRHWKLHPNVPTLQGLRAFVLRC